MLAACRLLKERCGVKRNNTCHGHSELFCFVLSEFRVTELENTAPAIWLSKGEATVNGSPGTFECRWTLEEADGGFGYGSASALWRLVFCDPTVWRRSE